MKFTKKNIILLLSSILILIIAYFWGGNYAVKNKDTSNETKKIKIQDEKNSKEKYLTDKTPEGKPPPVEWQDIQIDKSKELSCTLSVKCDSLLENISSLKQDKLDILPKDGIIFAQQKVSFYKGESVFDVLQREMQKNKIHMEFVMTPIYNSAYIEGINNLYEFDAGELSGWMYKVNGWFPNYGASRYQLQEGDVVEWLYTCDLGRDIGGSNSIR